MTRPAFDMPRRGFLKTTAAAGALAALATANGGLPAAWAAGDEEIKVGVIGCGGRGSGAAENVLQAAKGVKIIAIGDFFKEDGEEGRPPDRGVEPCRQRLLRLAESDARVKELGNGVDLPPERCYVGLDAYQKVINTPGVNYVILTTPPGFRPLHLEAAVAAGKNVFTEKPVAVDGAGVRLCLKTHEEAAAKKLGIVAGTQRRHQAGYLETMKRVHDGAIGDLLSARCYWNQGDIWFRPRLGGMDDLAYQLHNWYHFGWLSGDHICEQHVHQLDVMNWAAKSHPLRCLGMGGRTRPYADPQVDGNIFNFFAVEYEYPNGLHVHSMCRQIHGSDGNLPGASGVSEALVGSKGFCQANAYSINGKPIFTRQETRTHTNPYVQEHTDLIASIRAGAPLNELKQVAESTLAAIMGRMSAYTGKAVSWEQALNSQDVLMPAQLGSSTVPAAPLAMPGRTKLL